MKRALLLLGFAPLLWAQTATKQAPVQTKLLVPSATHNLGVLSFTFSSNPGCDKDGNMYFHVGEFSNVGILRMTADGSESKNLTASDQSSQTANASFSDFSVTPGGTVYVLAGADGKMKVLRYDENGAKGEPIPLDIPQSVIGTNIVATDSGAMLVFGFYDDSAPATLKGKGYTALLDASGRVRQEIQMSVPGLDISKLAAGQAFAPGMALGDDGNFYVPGSNQILVISPAGELIQRIPFENPDPKGVPSRIFAAGGMLVIVFSREDDHLVHESYLVLLAGSGDVVGYYQRSAELRGMGAMCFSPKSGITFLRAGENKHLELLTAQFR